MSDSANNDDAGQKATWKKKIEDAVQNDGANGAEVFEVSIPDGFVAAYTVRLNPAKCKYIEDNLDVTNDFKHSYPNVTLGDKRRLYICVIGDASQDPRNFNQSIQNAFLLGSSGSKKGELTGGGNSTEVSHMSGSTFDERVSVSSTAAGLSSNTQTDGKDAMLQRENWDVISDNDLSGYN